MLIVTTVKLHQGEENKGNVPKTTGETKAGEPQKTVDKEQASGSDADSEHGRECGGQEGEHVDKINDENSNGGTQSTIDNSWH